MEVIRISAADGRWHVLAAPQGAIFKIHSRSHLHRLSGPETELARSNLLFQTRRAPIATGFPKVLRSCAMDLASRAIRDTALDSGAPEAARKMNAIETSGIVGLHL